MMNAYVQLLLSRFFLPGLFLFIASTTFAQVDLAPNVSTSRHYKLIPMDRISISVFGQDDLSVEQRLNSQGQVYIPLLGDISLAGLSDVEAREKIERALLENEILVNPQVSVNILEYAPRSITILGEVGNPGLLRYPLEADNLDIVTVIAMAGDFSGTAKKSEVLVTRQNPQTGSKETFTVDVERILTSRSRRDKSANFYVLPNDVIFVPQRLF